MITLTKVPVTLPPVDAPTKEDVRAIVASFLNFEWTSAPAISLVMTYNKSYVNDHCTIERRLSGTTPTLEPTKLFIKFHKQPVDMFKQLVPTKQEEAHISHEYGQYGVGAKVYGFFQTEDGTLGRIEDFIDARCLQPEDVEDAGIRADVAKGLATFCSMQIALEKKAVGKYYEIVTDGLKKFHQSKKLKALGEQGGVSVDGLVDYDFAARLKRVVAKLKDIRAKTGWCIHDVKYMNALVKSKPTPGESRIVLIDFEFVMHNYRAFDIGGHFMQKMFRWLDEVNKMADYQKYTEEEKRHFCEEYARRWNEVTGDSDTREQVSEEAEYGYLLAIAFDTTICSTSWTVWAIRIH